MKCDLDACFSALTAKSSRDDALFEMTRSPGRRRDGRSCTIGPEAHSAREEPSGVPRARRLRRDAVLRKFEIEQVNAHELVISLRMRMAQALAACHSVGRAATNARNGISNAAAMTSLPHSRPWPMWSRADRCPQRRARRKAPSPADARSDETRGAFHQFWRRSLSKI